MRKAYKSIKHHDPALYQWDLYFLSHTSPNNHRGAAGQMQKESFYFDQLLNNITDKKFFHRKGVCSMKWERGGKFQDVTLILT